MLMYSAETTSHEFCLNVTCVIVPLYREVRTSQLKPTSARLAFKRNEILVQCCPSLKNQN